jgi:hypothetical protein
MMRWFSATISILIACAPALAKGPEVNLVDSRLSVSADAVTIGRLLQLVDLATGMKSRVPPELANRNISVRFSDLSVVDGVRKMFQGQPLDYVVIEGQGIIVTAASQAVTGTEAVPTYNQPPQASQQGQPFQQFQPPQPAEPPFGQDFQPQPVPGMINNPQQQQQQQPATIQTPFGQMANPRAQQGQPNLPGAAPAPQQNSLFPQISQPGQQQQQQTAPAFPGGQQGLPTPFGAFSPFGTPNQPVNNNQNNVFGTPAAQPR